MNTLVLSLGLGISLFQVTTAYPQHADQWQRPGPNDLRSPCPGLNTLANHGLIPRDGKNLNVNMLADAAFDTYHLATQVGAFVAAEALALSPNPNSGMFNLDDLKVHNTGAEHDGSLSRADLGETGDDSSFRQDIFNTVLAIYSRAENATIPVAAEARYMRRLAAEKSDPTFFYGKVQYDGSVGESALILSILGHPVTGETPVKYIKTLFEQERLPYAEGWRKQTVNITGVSLNTMKVALQGSGEVIPTA